MDKDERRKQVKSVVQRALQEWRSRKKDSKPSAAEVANRIKVAAFRDTKDGVFAFKKPAG
jgi:hypothetical protein